MAPKVDVRVVIAVSITVVSLLQVQISQVYYVVVQFYPWFTFYFPLFFFKLIYDNEYETKENKN